MYKKIPNTEHKKTVVMPKIYCNFNGSEALYPTQKMHYKCLNHINVFIKTNSLACVTWLSMWMYKMTSY